MRDHICSTKFSMIFVLLLWLTQYCHGAGVCYEENGEDRALKYAGSYQAPIDISTFPTICESVCGTDNFKYGGTYNGQSCFCGDSLPQNIIQDATCIGLDRILVFTTIVPAPPRWSPLMLNAPRTVFYTNESTTISVSTIGVLNTTLRYTFSFGEGIATIEDLVDIMQLINVQYSRAGPTRAWISAYDGLTAVAGGTIALQVIQPFSESDVSFTCETETTVGLPVECQLTVVQGSHLFGTVQFGYNLLEQFTVPQPENDGLGWATRRYSNSLGSCPAASLVISGLQAQYEGKISEVNLFVTVAAQFELLHLRVACTSSEKYVYSLDQCSTVEEIFNCISDQFSVAIQNCIPSTMVGCEAKLRQLKLGPVVPVELYNYQLIEKITVAPTTIGWQVFKLPTVWDVKPGDRIGMLFSGPSPLGCATPATYETNDLISTTVKSLNVGDIVSSSTLTRSNNLVFQMNAWSTMPRRASIVGSMSQDGNLPITLSLYPYSLDMKMISVTRTIKVWQSFNETDLIKNVFLKDTTATLTLKPHSGIADKYEWNFGDSSPVQVTNNRTTSHVYTTEGEFTLTVNMSNQATFKIVTCKVIITQPISLTGIVAPDAEVGIPVTISLTISPSSLFDCKWNINEQQVYQGSKLTYEITYGKPGLYNILIECTNHVTTETRQATQSVIERIQGLRVLTNSFATGLQRQLIFTFSQGSNIATTLMIDGQNRQATIDYQNKRIVSETFDASTPRNVSFNLEASNSLGSSTVADSIRFDIPVSMMVSKVEPKTVDINQDLNLFISFAGGTTVAVTIDWGDSTTVSEQSAWLQPWTRTAPFTKSYSQSGTYEVNITAESGSHRENELLVVTVQGQLGDYVIEPADAYAPMNNVFKIALKRINGDSAVLTDIKIDWGDATEAQTERFNETKSYQHIYNSETDATIQVTLTSSKGTKTTKTSVKVREAIEQFYCDVIPNPVALNSEITFVVSMQKAKNVQLVANLEVGKPAITQTLAVAETKRITYIYTTPGSYAVDITVQHVTGNSNCNPLVDVRRPIEKMVIEFDPVKESASGEVQAVIKYSGLQNEFPTNTTYSIDWGDGSALETGTLEYAQLPLTLSHVMPYMKYYQSVGTIDNVISKEKFTAQTGVFIRILSVELCVTVDSTGKPGYGTQQDRFAVGIPLRLTVLADGRSDNVGETMFNISYLTSGNQVTLPFNQSNYQVYTFTEQGSVTIEATGKNILSEAKTTKTIQIRATLRGLQLKIAGSVLTPSKEGTLELHFEAISSDTCICVTKADTFGSVVMPAEGQTATDCKPCPQFGQLSQRLSGNVLAIPIKYNTVGVDTIQVSAQNPTETVTETLFVTVKNETCALPELMFRQPEIVFPSTPLLVKFDQPVTIESTLNASQCLIDRTNSMDWLVEQVDLDTLNVIHSVNLSDLSSTRMLTLFVPSRRLLPGFYSATIKLTTQTSSDSAPIVLTKRSYLIVEQPALVVQFDQGNPISMTVGLEQAIVCFDPERHSYDPVILDRQLPQGINTWVWHCIQVGEKLTDDLVYPKPKGFAFTSPRSGCFGDGPGRINMSAGSLCFSSDNLEPNMKYRMQVRGSKADGRTAVAIMDLIAKPGLAPDVRITCAVPSVCRTPPLGMSESVAWAIAQSDDLYLVAQAMNVPPNAVVSYSWTTRYMYSNTMGPILSTEVQNVFTEGDNTPTLRIKREFLASDASATGCVICAQLQYAGAEGSRCLRFLYLKPPTMGDCQYLPQGSTSVCVTCVGFTTSLGSLSYQFYLTTDPMTTVAVSSSPNVCISIPFTRKEASICVGVSDAYGNQVRKCFGTINFPVPPEEELQATINELLITGKDQMQQVILTGNSSQKATVVISLANVVKEMKDISEQAQTTQPPNQTAVDQKRNDRSEVMKNLVTVVSSMVPINADSVLLSTSAISAVLKNTKDVDRYSQTLLTNTIKNIATNLKDLVGDENSDKKREITDGVLDSVLQLMDVMNSQIKDAVPKDIVHKKEDLHYDVDLEGEGLSSDGEDVWQELALQNSAHDQSQAVASSSLVMGNVLETRLKLLDPILIQDAPPVVTETSKAVVAIMKTSTANLTTYELPTSERGSHMILPDLCDTLTAKNISCEDQFTLQSIATKTNIFSFLKSPQSGIQLLDDSETFSLSIYNNGTQMVLEDTLQPFEIFLKKGPAFNTPNFTSVDHNSNRSQLPEPRIAADNSVVYQALLMADLSLPDDQSGITFQLLPEDITSCPQYLVVARMIKQPILSQATGGFDFWQMIPSNTAECVNMIADPDEQGYPYTFFLNNSQLIQARQNALEAIKPTKLSPEAKSKLYIGYRQLSDPELNKYGPNNPPRVPYPYRDQINNTALSRVFVSSCLSTDTEKPTKWSADGCVVGRKTTSRQTQCFCYHLSTFASGWLELPNTIDFDYVFANMDFTKNPTLYATEIAILALFILLFIWARRKDLKDVEKLGVTPLAENNPQHEYLYEVVVSTGRRTGSGTDSKVCCVLSGEYGETVPFVLQDPHRKMLQRGNVDRFLLACPRPLGKLIYCRLWHDNSGVGDRASWYCNYVGVVDLQTREKSHFIVGRWFAVEEDDGQVDRLVPVSSRDEMLAFVHMFATSVSRNLSEDHLWISVVARPATSRFTRMERVACCLLLLFLSMLTSAMFYKGDGAVKQPNLFTIGPFALTAQEVFIAIINNLITFVPLFLVAYLFRNSRLHTSHASKLREVVEDHLNEPIDVNSYPPITQIESFQQRSIETFKHRNNMIGEETEAKPIVRDRSCPWQMRILAWIVLILSVVTAAVFTTFYGISFGEAACKKWLSSLFLSFFTSVLLVQPIKVMLLALFISFVCKQTDRVDDIDILEEEDVLIEGLGRRYQLQMDEEYLHDEYLMRNFKPKRLMVLPPDPSELERSRAYRLKQRRANDIIREIFFYLIFLVLLLLVTTGFRDPNAFLLKRSIQSSFFPESYDDIHKTDEFYSWAKDTLIHGLRAQRWYNRDPALFQRGFLKDRSDRIIGYAIMRQVRVKPRSCNVYGKMRPLIKNCYPNYDIFNQDEETYGVGWVPFEGDAKHNNSSPEFTYVSQSALDGVPYMGDVTWYSGGGYVFMLRGSEDEMRQKLDELEQQHWVDFSTRAIIVQFTTYNPNINLFAIVTALIEKPGTGAMITSYRIETSNLFGSAATEAGVLQMAFQILFTLALFFYLIKEARSIYRERCNYFKLFWSYVELFIIIGSFAAIAAYVYMIVATKQAIAEFSRTHGNVFMNFQFLAYWNEMLTYLTALICFASTLKLVRLFRFNQRIGLLGSVLRYAAKDMKYFMIVFFLMFTAFVLVFYLLYADTLVGFRSFLGSTETCMQIILGKFDFTSMYEREMVLGPLLFSLFTLCVIFVMVSMFVAILDDSFQRVMEDLKLQSDDYEMTQFILSQLILWTGMNRTDWGKKIVSQVHGVPEPVYMEDSERILNEKLNEINRMMDEFLSYVQLNHLAETEK